MPGIREHLLRAIVIAAIVGTILVAINHGDHLENEPVCDFFFLKTGLCYLVPFGVSLFSALWAMRNDRRASSGDAPPDEAAT